MDPETVERIDDKIWDLKTSGEIPRDASRSDILRELIHEWLDGEIELDQGNHSTHAAQTAD